MLAHRWHVCGALIALHRHINCTSAACRLATCRGSVVLPLGGHLRDILMPGHAPDHSGGSQDVMRLSFGTFFVLLALNGKGQGTSVHKNKCL
uniref:Putative secreted protein n=1 Tax=Ixodes ricinus TaxID=34613 RepID=A0A6B0U7Q2_IXORI